MHPAGWYTDPEAPHQLRWWDGTAWTTHVRAAAPPSPDAGDAPAAADPVTPGDSDPAAAGATGWTSATAVHADPATPMPPPPEQRRSTGRIIAVVAGVAALVVLAGIAVWLLASDGLGSTEPATYQTQTSAEMVDFAGDLQAIGEGAGFNVEESFGFVDNPANSNLNFHGQACERRAEVDHLEAVAGAQMSRSDGTQAVLGVGFGNDADFHAMVNELITGVDECRDGREVDALNSLSPPRHVITESGHPAKVRFASDITSMGQGQTMLLIIYADGPTGVQVVIAAPDIVDDGVTEQLVDEAERLLDAAIDAIEDRGYLAAGNG